MGRSSLERVLEVRSVVWWMIHRGDSPAELRLYRFDSGTVGGVWLDEEGVKGGVKFRCG